MGSPSASSPFFMKLRRLAQAQDALRLDFQQGREASLVGLAQATQALQGQLGHAQRALAEVKALEQGRTRQLDYATDALRRLESIVAGSSARGTAGESILARALGQLPPDLLAHDVAFRQPRRGVCAPAARRAIPAHRQQVDERREPRGPRAGRGPWRAPRPSRRDRPRPPRAPARDGQVPRSRAHDLARGAGRARRGPFRRARGARRRMARGRADRALLAGPAFRSHPLPSGPALSGGGRNPGPDAPACTSWANRCDASRTRSRAGCREAWCSSRTPAMRSAATPPRDGARPSGCCEPPRSKRPRSKRIDPLGR